MCSLFGQYWTHNIYSSGASIFIYGIGHTGFGLSLLGSGDGALAENRVLKKPVSMLLVSFCKPSYRSISDQFTQYIPIYIYIYIYIYIPVVSPPCIVYITLNRHWWVYSYHMRSALKLSLIHTWVLSTLRRPINF